jgi:hypothetical protein
MYAAQAGFARCVAVGFYLTRERTTLTGEFGEWSPERPSTLVIACSDGRLQQATHQFLAHHNNVTRYERL